MEVRLIRSGELEPALNLALDEALLRSATPTLRLYAWNPPGLSLGFFQCAAEFAGMDGFTLVRRPTGGGAIAHTGELTISWIDRRVRVEQAYTVMNDIVTRALRSLGVEVGRGEEQPEAAPRGLCFDAHTCYDLLAGEAAPKPEAKAGKVFGSAQRRAKESFLLHGTLVLEPNPISAGAVSLRELLGREVRRDEMEQRIISAAPWPLRASQPTANEWKNAKCLVSERYGSEAWTLRR